MAQTLAVDCDYPGGNIIVQSVEGDRIVVRQDLRDTGEWWFYYNFRVRGAGGRRIEVVFDDPGAGPIAACGPAVSLDGRHSWQWAVADFDARRFRYLVPSNVDEVYFALSIPYQLADFQRFTDRHADSSMLKVTTLTDTPGGRKAPLLTIGDSEKAEFNVLFTCRHHACESVANYVMEGLLDELLSPAAASFRSKCAVSAIPFIDLDGVEDGDQGKSRLPRDHNRDYGDDSLYATVQATKELVRQLAERNLVFFADLHCPWIRGAANEAVFLVFPPPPADVGVTTFAQALGRTDTGFVPYTGKFDVPFGTAWNKPNAEGWIGSRGFVGATASRTLKAALTLEFTYALAEGVVISAERARIFGRGFARAMMEFLNLGGSGK